MNTTPTFVVPIADLDYGPKEVDWELGPDWLGRALDGTEATPRGSGRLRAELTLDGRQVMVRGKVRAPLTMPCARTLDPTEVDVDAELFLLLRPAATGSEPKQPRRRRGRNEPKARKKAADGEEGELLREEAAAGDTYDGEQVVLDHFVSELIQLELPMFPLRSEDSEAIAPSPPESGRRPLDPRLAPLAAIKARLENPEE